MKSSLGFSKRIFTLCLGYALWKKSSVYLRVLLLFTS